MSGKGKGGKGGKAKGGKAKAKPDGTFTFTWSQKPANRLNFARNYLKDSAESRRVALEKGLGDDWVAHKWVLKGRADTVAIRDPKGNCYAGIKEALDAYNGVKKYVFLCQQQDADENVCNRAKEACPGKTLGAYIFCICNKGKKHRTPSLNDIGAGVTESQCWELATEEVVDNTKVTKRGKQSGLDNVTRDVSKIIEENKDSFGEFKSKYTGTIWSEETLQHKFALDLLQKKQTLEYQQSKSITNDYTRLSGRVSKLKSVLTLLTKEEMDAAIKSCGERHPNQASVLDKLGSSFHSGQPLLDEAGNVGNDRIKECQDKLLLEERWKRRLATAVTEFNGAKIAGILSTSLNVDDEKLVVTFKMHAHDAYERDPNTIKRNRHRANNKIDGTPVETLITEAVHVASTSVYLGRRDKPDPIVEAIKSMYNANKNDLSPKEMADRIRAICEARRKPNRP